MDFSGEAIRILFVGDRPGTPRFADCVASENRFAVSVSSKRSDALDRLETERFDCAVGDVDDAAGFYVADDGPGIPEGEREAVFEHGHSTSDEGTGVGLAIVKRIAGAHDWTVSVGDGREGGARFEFETGGRHE